MEQRAEILRDLMEKKGMKVSDIVKLSGLPYSTVKAILERGAEKAGYVNVCKICNALGISADELEKMVSERNYAPTTQMCIRDSCSSHHSHIYFQYLRTVIFTEYKRYVVNKSMFSRCINKCLYLFKAAEYNHTRTI